MTRKALILGVGPAQRDAIHWLRQRQWDVLACAWSRVGLQADLVSSFAEVDIKDSAAVEALARTEGVDLVYSVGSDLAMPTASQVSERLGLPLLVSSKTATLLNDKVRLRALLAERRIDPVCYRGLKSASDLQGWEVYPAMVKPADSQGQRGVRYVATADEARVAVEAALAISPTRTAIVEEFLAGPELSVNAFIENGEIVFSLASDRLVVEHVPGGIPRAHVVPARSVDLDTLRRIDALVRRCVEALAVRRGPLYFQIKATPSGPRIVEITSRLDGCHMWRLIHAYCGVDLLAATFDALEGREVPDLRHRPRLAGASLRFFLQPPGTRFSRAEHVAPANALHVEHYLEDGATVPASNGVLEKVGYYIVEEPSCALQ